jgi:phospholipid/cholesterol/gamma-HCH transport system ATP-binding protein
MSVAAEADVRFENAVKVFGDRHVLDEVSFEVAPGETLCIMGRSGTGKSVTLKLMIRLLKPDSGKVFIQGQNIDDMDEDALSKVRRRMGFLFQSGALFSPFTLYENLAIPLARRTSKSSAEIKDLVRQRLQDVGLEKDGGKMPSELSGGMKKRAGLARALVLDPCILLADEPTSGLDRVTASEIDELLLKIREKDKTTMVIVTHDVRGARRVSDRIAVLDAGRVIGIGPIAELEKSENQLVRALVSEEEYHAH